VGLDKRIYNISENKDFFLILRRFVGY